MGKKMAGSNAAKNGPCQNLELSKLLLDIYPLNGLLIYGKKGFLHWYHRGIASLSLLRSQ